MYCRNTLKLVKHKKSYPSPPGDGGDGDVHAHFVTRVADVGVRKHLGVGVEDAEVHLVWGRGVGGGALQDDQGYGGVGEGLVHLRHPANIWHTCVCRDAVYAAGVAAWRPSSYSWLTRRRLSHRNISTDTMFCLFPPTWYRVKVIFFTNITFYFIPLPSLCISEDKVHYSVVLQWLHTFSPSNKIVNCFSWSSFVYW